MDSMPPMPPTFPPLGAMPPGFALQNPSGAGSRPMAPMPISIEEFADNNTLYIRNINERLKQAKVKSSLRAVFKQFGTIVEIYCWAKSLKRKGQAWVVFRDVESAKRAKIAMQGFPFFHKPLIIRFAKMDSDVVAKEKGTFVPRSTEQQQQTNASRRGKQQQQHAQQEAIAAAAATRPAAAAPAPQQWPAESAAAYRATAHTNPPLQTVPEFPNKILFVTNLPDDITDAMLQTLFAQYPGYIEVRLVPGRGMAFVEYEHEMQAAVAKEELSNFKISPEHAMTISFSKK